MESLKTIEFKNQKYFINNKDIQINLLKMVFLSFYGILQMADNVASFIVERIEVDLIQL
jgi:hypothetical protein